MLTLVSTLLIVVAAQGVAVEKQEIAFKLRAVSSAEKPGGPASLPLARLVANVSGLSAPKRIFRPAGKHEARHSEFGLDRVSRRNPKPHASMLPLPLVPAFSLFSQKTSIESRDGSGTLPSSRIARTSAAASAH